MGRAETSPAAPRIRLKQLAFELGLSQTQVSRALAGYSDVSKETRKRVIQAARASGYLTAKQANRPRGLQSGFVGMLLPIQGSEILDPNVTRFMAGLSDGLMRRGRDLFLAAVPPGQDDLTVLRHLVDSQRVDGVVMHRLTHDDPCVRLLLENDYPFVTLGRLLTPHDPHPWFDMDAEAGFEQATRLLVGLGHTRFGVFGPSEPFSYASLRRHGVERALKWAGLSLLPENIAKAPVPDPGAIARAAEALLSGPNRPSAVLALLDKYALALLEAADRLGLSVPEDLSIIGFGDIPEAALATPGLSTFAQHSRSNGEMVADMIINRIDSGEIVEQRLVPVDFLPRGSHGPAPRPSRRRTGQLDARPAAAL